MNAQPPRFQDPIYFALSQGKNLKKIVHYKKNQVPFLITFFLCFQSPETHTQRKINMAATINANNVWDSKTQTFHGGQEHRFIQNFVEDFSVTTNYLGTPRKALEAAREAVSIEIG